MPAEITLPVRVRVGDMPESHIGDLTLPVADDGIDLSTLRLELADFYRDVADALDQPIEDEGDDDAAP
ncbi:hypothetical protein [Streptomyces griseus]|uniref:hypothetical protein n=1 Tax=Streptomyces griseus TaxID=1911 RepID=UPI0004CB3962|nr:hypothetical protein [Streptomyces griseus]